MWCKMDTKSLNQKCKIIPKNVSTELPTTYKLSQEQFQYYEENGFLVIKRLIDFADLYNYKQHFIRICKGLELPANITVVKERSLIDKVKKKEDYIVKFQDILHDEVFMTYTEHPLILDIVGQFIGDDITVINSMFINKPPGTNIHPPHQDLHYFPHRPAEKIIGTWTAIDDVTVDNGCLWIVPGSHKPNILYQHSNVEGALKLYHGIIDESVAHPDMRIPLEMGPGDTVFFHPLVVHGSGANTSKNYRKCISTHYASSHCELLDLTGTVQDIIKEEVEAEGRRRGLHNVDFTTIMRIKSKEVRRKSKL